MNKKRMKQTYVHVFSNVAVIVVTVNIEEVRLEQIH